MCSYILRRREPRISNHEALSDRPARRPWVGLETWASAGAGEASELYILPKIPRSGVPEVVNRIVSTLSLSGCQEN